MSCLSRQGARTLLLALRLQITAASLLTGLAVSALWAGAHAHHPGGGGSVGIAGPINTIPGTTLDRVNGLPA